MRKKDPLWADLVTERVLSVIGDDKPGAVARRLGINPGTVWDWRNGGKTPDLYVMAMVARVYGVDANWLIGVRA